MSKQVKCKGCNKRLFDVEGDDYIIEAKCPRSSCGETHTYQSEKKPIEINKGSERNVITIDTNSVLP